MSMDIPKAMQKQPCPLNWAQIRDRLLQQDTPADKAGSVEASTPSHGDCEEPKDIDDPKVANQTQENQPSTRGLKLQKDELDRQNSKRTGAPPLTSGKSPLNPGKRPSSSSSEFEDLDASTYQTGFYKRNLNRYRQERWPFQPCLIGRP